MISVKGLSYRYSTGKVLQFPDLDLEKGGHYLLLGESGSGKTTLLHLLGGLLRSQNGKILIAGTDLAKLRESDLDHFRGTRIGFVFQKNHLISSLTVKKNLLISPYLAGLKPDHDDVEKILLQLGISETINAKITQLSQGQLQRVAIARAVLNRPALILADEPTSALDDKNCEKVIQLLVGVAKESNATLIIATHDQRLKSKISNQILLTENSLVQ
jgi:putative ABC transport system ATP-binding protein